MNIRKMCEKAARFTLIAAAAIAMAGCGQEKETAGSTVHKAPEGATLKLAFVTNNASDFWKIASAGVDKYEKEAGVQVDVSMPNPGTTAEQNRIIEDLVSQGYHGIAVSAVAPADQVPEINRAARKTNVITHDSDAPKSDRLAYIGTNNFEAGKKLGEQIVKLLPQGGEIAVFVGTFSADNARERLRGIEEAIKDHKIEIIEKREDNTDRALARSNVENVLNARPNVDVLVGLWSYNGPAIAAALEASGKKDTVKAAVFDEEEGTLKGIADGTIAVTVVQKPFEFGYQSSKMLHQLATTGTAPQQPIVDTGVEVIEASNVEAFRQKLAEMTKS